MLGRGGPSLTSAARAVISVGWSALPVSLAYTLQTKLFGAFCVLPNALLVKGYSMMSAEKLIPTIIEDKFEVENFGSFGLDETYDGTARAVVHNGVKLTFKPFLSPNQSEDDRKNFVGVFVEYTDGPKEKLDMKFSCYAVMDSSKAPFKLIGKYDDVSGEFARGGSSPGYIRVLPRDPTSLRAQGWLHSDNSVLHIMAVLLVPESAFEDPEMKYQVSSVSSNPILQSLFEQIGMPVDTSSPYKFSRFDFVSSDDQHFYVHKDVLSFSSDPFKQMFDSDKPQDAQFAYIQKGFMKLENLSGAALKEIFSYIYLGHTSPELKNNCALQVLDGANVYGLRGLLLLCEQKLVAEAKQNKDITSLVEQLQVSLTHQLSALTDACVRSLDGIMTEQKDISEEVVSQLIELAVEHKHTELKDVCERKLIGQVHLLSSELTTDGVLHFLSIAGKYNLKKLLTACSEWFGKNWDKLTQNGLSALMEDKTDGLLPLMMGHVLSEYANK